MIIESVKDTTAIPEYRAGTVIKVVGVGGAGGNAVNCMIRAGLTDVEFIAVNTDIQALAGSLASTRVPLGTKLTNGRGAGGIPQVGEDAANEDAALLQERISGADMIFVTAGMGGGTGSGAAPVISRLAREMDILTVGVVTTPYSYEGAVRLENAEHGIKKLRDMVDTLLIIPNDLLSQVSKPGTRLVDGFECANGVLRQGVQGISDIVMKVGYMNTDFADVKVIMDGKGDALMGIGTGNGENRAIDAATAAINNPLLKNIRIDGAKNLLINVTAGSDLLQEEFDEINTFITANSHARANRIIGYVIDETMESEVQVTVVATEFLPTESARTDEQAMPTEEREEALGSVDGTGQSNKYISLDEWSNMINGSQMLEDDMPNGEFPVVPESGQHVLQIPTILRQQKAGK